MIFKSKAPLRIGFAGGGTDVSPYSEIYGGAVLNATISLYARVSIEKTKNKQVEIIGRGKSISVLLAPELEINGNFDLTKAVYNHFSVQFMPVIEGLRIHVDVDVPHGSGLGTSSTLVVALTGAFARAFDVELDASGIASLAYEIERVKLKWAGGRQDQYAASFGGFNMMHFSDNLTSVQKLNVSKPVIDTLEENLVLYYTGIARNSADIIRQQSRNVETGSTASIESMHRLKEEVYVIKDLLETGNMESFGEIMDKNFFYKKNMADGISNEYIESIYRAARDAGASGGKISGAGGGGFVLFYCPPGTRTNVEGALAIFPGYIQPFRFESAGLETWTD